MNRQRQTGYTLIDHAVSGDQTFAVPMSLTAPQITGTYFITLAGGLYPAGIPIEDEGRIEELIAELAAHKAAHPDFAVESVHFFPLGGIAASAEARFTAAWTASASTR